MSTIKTFASQADLEEKRITFARISEHAYAYTAEGDPNTGVVVGDDSVMVLTRRRRRSWRRTSCGASAKSRICRSNGSR